jgi:hypothetical protein
LLGTSLNCQVKVRIINLTENRKTENGENVKMGTELFFGRVGVGVTSNLISNTHIEREPAISAVKMVASYLV